MNNLRAYTSSVLESVRQSIYRPFYVVWPISESDCTDCGFDELTQSPQNITCLTCGGTGKELAWSQAEVHGRLQHYDFVKLAAAGLPPGIEIGDSVVYVSEDVKDMIVNVRQSEFGYVFLDEDTYRPFSIAPTGVGHKDEWRIELKRTQIDARAAGY